MPVQGEAATNNEGYAMNTSEVLHKAADLIEERGWQRGGEVSDPWGGGAAADAPVCLEGGIMAALGLGSTSEGRAAFYSCAAHRAVADYLGRNPRPAACPIMDAVWRWNDEPGRTAAEVVEVLRAAAAIEAAREDAEVAERVSA